MMKDSNTPIQVVNSARAGPRYGVKSEVLPASEVNSTSLRISAAFDAADDELRISSLLAMLSRYSAKKAWQVTAPGGKTHEPRYWSGPTLVTAQVLAPMAMSGGIIAPLFWQFDLVTVRSISKSVKSRGLSDAERERNLEGAEPPFRSPKKLGAVALSSGPKL